MCWMMSKMVRWVVMYERWLKLLLYGLVVGVFGSFSKLVVCWLLFGVSYVVCLEMDKYYWIRIWIMCVLLWMWVIGMFILSFRVGWWWVGIVWLCVCYMKLLKWVIFMLRMLNGFWVFICCYWERILLFVFVWLSGRLCWSWLKV